ncbi:gamma-aminobutyric acid receptor subunit beta-1-like [Branchiostoma floridae x Branchiostoma belcheri]
MCSASQLPTSGAPNDTSYEKVKEERMTVLKKMFEDASAFKSKLASEDNATQEEWNGWKTGENMPQGYDSNVSPQTEEKLEVTSTVKILHVGPLSEENANLSVTVEYSMAWVDARLRGLSRGWAPVPASFMWAPPLAFGSAVRRATEASKKKSGGRGGSDDDISMWLHPSGILLHRLTRTLYLSCVPSMARYPLDQQECSFKLHGYSGLYFPLHKPKNASSPGPVTTDMTAVVSQFELTGLNVYSSVQQIDNTEAACHLLTGKCAYNAEYCTDMRGCSHGNECAVCKTYFGSCQYESNDCIKSNTSGLTQVSTLEVRLQFSRRLQSHVLVTFLPTTSVVMTSWLGFWLHPQEVNGRVSLGISTLLSLIIKSSYGANPQTHLVRAYDVWMSGCLAMVMLALLETVLANYILSGGKLPGCLGLWQTSVGPLSKPSTAWVGGEEDRVDSAEKRAVQLDFCAKIVFPVAFVAFLIGFFTYYA